MILTENEAYKKWCPFSKPDFVSDCKASGCAAWRWDVGLGGVPAMKKEEGEYRKTGHCGIAGRPGVE